jgi:hypothetical protein
MKSIWSDLVLKVAICVIPELCYQNRMRYGAMRLAWIAWRVRCAGFCMEAAHESVILEDQVQCDGLRSVSYVS